MQRRTEREQIQRFSVKTLHQVFMACACEGLGCSMFEAQALTELIKEVYFPWLTQPEAIQAGQLALVAVSADEPGHKPLSKCKMTPVLLTLYAGEEDHEYRLKQGVSALRQYQIERMANEALDQGALLTGEDLAFRIFNCGLRTISRDPKALTEKGVVVPLRLHLKQVKAQHELDLAMGYGTVYLPYALERKYLNANRELAWQYVFPAPDLSIDPISGLKQRHHLNESNLQKAVKQTARSAKIEKPVTPHTFRQCEAYL